MNNRPEITTLDEKSRESIVLDINKNLFVEAGAGSGKTTMLVNRMVAMVEAGIPVEKICAITFTKNAALEFYERFQAKLIDRANSNNQDEPKRAGDLSKPTEETRKRCQTALENIDLCFMGTIDSFCYMILSEHPTEANIPSDARLISDDEANNIYKQFYLECRRGLYGKEIKELADRFGMFFKSAEDNFAQLMSEIMDRRNIKFIYDDKLCVDFFKCFSNVREDIKTVLNKFNEDKTKIIIPCKDETKDPIADIYDPANETLQKGWHYNYSGVEWSLNSIKDLLYEGSKESLALTKQTVIRDVEGNTKVSFDPIKDTNNKDALIYKLKNYKYQNSLKLVLSCVKYLEEKMRKEGRFTFFDYLYYLRNMLVEDSKKEGKLIEYIYNRHSYFLIDEFQDTNPMQAEIFFYLAAKDPKQKSWKDCNPKDGSLFIVGDPKQSIYRFRAADISSYINIKNMFKDDEIKLLVNNFRSKNEVKQYYNEVFNEVMPKEEKDQSKYRDIENVDTLEEGDKSEEFRGLFTYESYSDKLLKAYPDMSDENQLVAIVKRLVNNPNCKIIDKDKDLREITYSDFMIIFSNKKKIPQCMKAFKDNNIPTRVEGSVPFEECEGLKTIECIYKTIIDKTDILSLITTLYSPVFGFNENDLASYRSQGGSIKLDFEKEYASSNIEQALKKLVNTSKDIQKYTPSALYEKIMDEYEIFKYVSSENLEVIYYTLELIRGEEYNGNIVSFLDAVNFINDLLEGKSKLERCLSLKQNVNAVHIANLHKVKGLEAPVVILAKAGKSPRGPNPTIRVEYEQNSVDGYVLFIKDNNYTGVMNKPLIDTNDFKEQYEAEKISLLKEEDRLVYVAATRARNVLIVNHPKEPRKENIISGNGRSKWKVLKEHINEDIFEKIAENSNYKEQKLNEIDADSIYKNAIITKITNEETYSFKQPSDIQSSSKTNEKPYENGGLPIKNDETYSTLIGTMVHRLMEMIIMSKDNISKEDAINNILTEYVTEEFVNNLSTFKEKLIKVYEVMHNGGFNQKGKAPQNLLPILLNADKCYSEVPFTFLDDNNNLWNGIIDLIYEKDNKLHIIDWKTNKDDSNLDEHYKDQLEAYKKAVKQTLNIDVEDALIYHITLI